MTGFVHLHVHGEGSLLDGLSRPGDISRAAHDMGMDAVAQTDHGSLTQALAFARSARDIGVKPIIGVEFYLSLGSRFERNEVTTRSGDVSSGEGNKTKRYEHLTLLARTTQGWENLVRLFNESQDSYWYVPRIDYDLMSEHNAGLICLTGCLGGPILGPLSRHVLHEDALISYKKSISRFRDQMSQDAFDNCLALAKQHLGDDDADDAALPDEVTRTLVAFRREQLETTDYIDVARQNLARLISIYGVENVYVELMEHGIPAEQKALPLAQRLAVEAGVACVATNDSHFTHEEDAVGHDGWLAMRTSGGKLNTPGRFRFHGDGYWIRSEQQMRALHTESWWQQACDETVKVAERVDEWILPEYEGVRLPTFPLPPNEKDSLTFLVRLVKEGALERYGSPLPAVVKKRLAWETRVIRDLGLIDYFLIDWDLIAWARSTDTPTDWIARAQGDHLPDERETKTPIFVGPGRGSAAGSCVSYCLGIVNLDPLRHNLYFDRFLDPTRVGMPDVDTDFEKERRDECYAFLVERYGRDRIARLGTVGRKQVKAAIKSGCSIVGINEQTANTLTKLIPSGEDGDMPLPELLDATNDASAAFRREMEAYPNTEQMDEALTYAHSFVGLSFNEGIHACGVLIGDRDMTGEIPMRVNRESSDENAPRVTSWDGREIDSLGMLKLDLLGLRTLDIIHTALTLASAQVGHDLTYEDIPDPDDTERDDVAAAWAMLRQGETAGVFQFSSSGMTTLIEQIEPREWSHITAAAALYRPGPLKAGMHTQYADRLNGREGVDYGIFSARRDPDEIEVIEQVLGETFGIPVYQEQAMALGRSVAGFADAMVNKLRKAISKKQVDQFPALGEKFVAGAILNHTEDGAPKVPFAPDTAEALWKALEGSAHYSFNKSHSAAYALLGFQTAWLKSTYPAAFGAAVLAHTDRSQSVERSGIIESMRRMGVSMMPPSINDSVEDTSNPDPHTILVGFSDIKDVGKSGVDIVAERHEHGPYTSLSNLISRVPTLTSLNITALIEAGCLDTFGPRRGQTVIAGALASHPDMEVPEWEWGDVERWTGQKKRIGIAFGTHPLDVAGEPPKRWIDSRGHRVEKAPSNLSVVFTKNDGDPVHVIAVIGALVTKTLSSGVAAFLTLENQTQGIDAAIWPRSLSRIAADSLSIGTVVIASGNVKMREVVSDEGEVTVKAELWINSLVPLDVPDHGRRRKVRAINLDVLTQDEPEPAPTREPPPLPAKPTPEPEALPELQRTSLTLSPNDRPERVGTGW